MTIDVPKELKSNIKIKNDKIANWLEAIGTDKENLEKKRCILSNDSTHDCEKNPEKCQLV